MNINLNFLKVKSSVPNFSVVNNSIKKQINTTSSSKNNKNHDRISISPQSKMMSIIENLSKQKENIIESRNKLVTTTIENGGDIKNIKDQLKLYAKQLQDIDKQIADIKSQQTKSVFDKNKKEKTDTNKIDNDTKTDAELEIEELSALANISDNVKYSRKISSIKDNSEGEIRIKKSELNLEQLRIDNLESKHLLSQKQIVVDGAVKNLEPVNVKDLVDNIQNIISQKQEALSQSQEKVNILNSIEIKQITNSIEKLNNNNNVNDKSNKDEYNEKSNEYTNEYIK